MRIPDCKITFLGTGSALPLPGRHPSAQFFQYGSEGVLIDCGEGTQMQFTRFDLRTSRIDHILISHLHGDHVFGLPGLISSFSHLGRERPLNIYGPEGISGFIDSVRNFSEMRIQYPMTVIELTGTEPTRFLETEGLEISFFPLRHRVSAIGYCLREKQTSFRFNQSWIDITSPSPEQFQEIRRLTENSIKSGTPIPMPEAIEIIPGIRYAYCSDTVYMHELAVWLEGVNFLYHETTFLHDLKDLAKETGHSTAREAGKIAREVGADWLITGHYSSRYQDIELISAEARREFEYVIAGEDGLQLDLRKMAMEIGGRKKK